MPEARITVAHGQMNEHQLEQVMVDFWERKADVLVCTTIVESGLDIANANTLIIERADLLGLSQLHQLRGRVGRGGERAYAYFLYPPEKPLTETAHDRLATIAQHADLGAGMAVAMKDLEIRGAGNLLGGEQSGHIADVGFDLYVRLVGEAVAEYRGDGAGRASPRSRSSCRSTPTCRTSTCPSERLRLEMYKRLAEVAAAEQVDEVRAELADRYGTARRRRSTTCSRSRVLRVKAQQARAHRHQRAGQLRPVRPGGPARLARGCGSTGSTRRRVVKPALHSIWCPARPDRGRRRRSRVRDVRRTRLGRSRDRRHRVRRAATASTGAASVAAVEQLTARRSDLAAARLGRRRGCWRLHRRLSRDVVPPRAGRGGQRQQRSRQSTSTTSSTAACGYIEAPQARAGRAQPTATRAPAQPRSPST